MFVFFRYIYKVCSAGTVLTVAFLSRLLSAHIHFEIALSRPWTNTLLTTSWIYGSLAEIRTGHFTVRLSYSSIMCMKALFICCSCACILVLILFATYGCNILCKSNSGVGPCCPHEGSLLLESCRHKCLGVG
jgi:hypothetical protein